MAKGKGKKLHIKRSRAEFKSEFQLLVGLADEMKIRSKYLVAGWDSWVHPFKLAFLYKLKFGKHRTWDISDDKVVKENRWFLVIKALQGFLILLALTILYLAFG